MRRAYGSVSSFLVVALAATLPTTVMAAPAPQGGSPPGPPGAAPATGESAAGDSATEPPVAKENLHDPMVEARRAYDRGRMLYDKAEYEEALGSFLDAQRLYASPDHHFNIARCYEALGRYPLAVEYYRAYLRSDPADRANIENTITRIEKIVEGGATDQPPPDPQPQPDPEPDPDQEVTATDSEPVARPGRPLVITGAVLVGVGAALGLGGGIGAGAMALNRSDRVFEVVEDGNPDGRDLAETRTLDEEGRRFEQIQIATAVVGGLVAATGVALLVVGLNKNKRAPSASAMVGRGLAGVSLRGRF